MYAGGPLPERDEGAGSPDAEPPPGRAQPPRGAASGECTQRQGKFRVSGLRVQAVPGGTGVTGSPNPKTQNPKPKT